MHIKPEFDSRSDDLDSSSDGKVDHGETRSLERPFRCGRIQDFSVFLKFEVRLVCCIRCVHTGKGKPTQRQRANVYRENVELSLFLPHVCLANI